MVVSEEPLLPLEDRDRDCGVEVREAIPVGLGRKPCGVGEVAMGQARRGVVQQLRRRRLRCCVCC
jgi:hypothetical protein